MNVTPDTLAQALTSYAVMLNRPQWLDPAKLLLQEQVWDRMVERESGDGLIRLEDFEQAIEERLAIDPPHAIVPNRIVASAASLARGRLALADRMFTEWAADNLLFSEISSMHISGDIDHFDRFVRHATSCVILSGRDVTEIGKLTEAIDHVSRQAINAAHQLGTVGPINDDMIPATSLIQEWLSQ